MIGTNQIYELYFILNPELSAEQIDTQISKISKLVKDEIGGENIEIEKQGLKRLAYRVKKHYSGSYVLMNFELELENCKKIGSLEKKLNIEKEVLRYIILNQTEFLIQKSKEKPSATEIKSHNELNKKAKRPKDRKCIVKHMGLRVIDYKDVDFLQQFVSPYAKIFHRDKTGTGAKFQRKIAKAVKRARHMALMPFTPQE